MGKNDADVEIDLRTLNEVEALCSNDIRKTPVCSRVLTVVQLCDKDRLELNKYTHDISYLDICKARTEVEEEIKKIEEEMRRRGMDTTLDVSGG